MRTLRISKNNTVILRAFVLFLFAFGLIATPTAEAGAGFPQTETEPGHRIALEIDNSALTAEQLKKIQEIGIDLLEISFPVRLPDSGLDQFYLLLDSDIHFTTEHQLKTAHESLGDFVRSTYNNVPNQLKDNIAAIKIFDFPADYRMSYSSSADSLLSQLSASLDKPLYYQSAFSVPEFPIQNIDFYASRVSVQPDNSLNALSSVILFKPSNNPAVSLQTFETILNQSLTKPESLIIVPASWFLSRVESQASFSTILSSYLDGEAVDFPMPAATSDSSDANGPIILLLFIWASFILHYKYQPTYQTTLPRYFFYHSFFVHDVMKHRIRNAAQGIILLFQHAVITGFLFYLLADGFTSDTGLSSLSHHYPALFFSGFEKISVFGIGMFIAIISHVISIAWLYLPNKKLTQLNQVINLYSWPFHINLIIVTITVYFVQVQSAQNWTIAMVIMYFFFWFSSFVTAATDSARFLEKYRALNLFLTVGLYFLFILVIFGIFLWMPGIYQPLEMAFMLP